jgi:hypothetical protein
VGERRTNAVGMFSNETAVVGCVCAVLLEQAGEWATQRARHIALEGTSAVSDTGSVARA